MAEMAAYPGPDPPSGAVDHLHIRYDAHERCVQRVRARERLRPPALPQCGQVFSLSVKAAHLTFPDQALNKPINIHRSANSVTRMMIGIIVLVNWSTASLDGVGVVTMECTAPLMKANTKKETTMIAVKVQTPLR